MKPGPGKFEGCDDARIARVLYDITMNSGCDADCGECDTTGWYGLILHRDHGYIVSEDSQGFFDYTNCDTRVEAQMEYARIESEIAESLDEAEETDEEYF